MEKLKRTYKLTFSLAVVLLTFYYQKSNWIFEKTDKPKVKAVASKAFKFPSSICPRWRLEESSYKFVHKNSTVGPPTKKLTSVDHVTSAATSLVTLINRRTSYYVCDHIAVRIEARTMTNETKHYGGDYFRTKIYSTDPYSASGPDHFIDFQNGTYVALFTLRWKGEVKIHVSLVHPSEALPILLRTTKDGKAGKLFTFFGIFENRKEDKNFTEDVVCTVAPFDTSYCNVSANDTHGPWFCQQPKNFHLTCKDWAFHHMSTAQSSKKLYASLSSTEKLIFKSSKKEVKTSEAPIQVLPKYVGSMTALPRCTSSYVPHTVETDGYFYQDKWQPLNCSIKSFNSTDTHDCLSSKRMHLFGDSTARQMFMDLKGKLKWTCTEQFFCLKENASIHFTFHGLPIRSGHEKIPIKNLTYVARQIESMKGGKDVVIVLSIWAHFGQPEGSFYRDRLLAVKGAIERLWQRSPETRVVVRSANTRGHSIGGFILISSDWIALQGEKILRDVFSSDKRFDFLDVWDMSLVQKSKDDVHPLPPTLSQLMDNLLTLICKD